MASALSCSLCSAAIADGSKIVCSKCAGVLHPTTQCTGLSATAIRCLQEEADHGIQYICTGCRCSATSNSNVTQGAATQMFAMLQSLAGTVAKLSEQVSRLVNNVGAAPVSSESLPSRQTLFDEIREFERTKKES